MKKTLAAPVLIATSLMVAACGGGGGDNANSSAARSDTSASNGGTSLPLGLGCGWQAVSDADVTNVLYPDQAAMYWLATIPQIPGARLRVDGEYPQARYFSFNVYDPLLRPVDAIYDAQIAPVSGANPYAVAGLSSGGRYRAYVAFSTKPDQPAANTVYAGFTTAGSNTLPNPTVTTLAYRIYVPADGLRGGVALPQLTLETADGSRELGTLPTCDAPLLPNAGGNLPSLGLNPLLADNSYPETLSALPYPLAAYPAKTSVFYGLPDSYIGILNNVSPVPFPLQPSQIPLTGGGGFLSNKDNAYTVTTFSHDHGSIFVLRAHAPSYRTQPGTAFGSEQVRYWSVCQNEFATQRYVACTRDEQVPLDANGFFTVVVSDPDQRPANAVAANGIAWLPWGAYPDGLLIYRQLLASPSYARAIRNVPAGTAPAQIMGDDLPLGVYCARSVFEAAGNRAADIYAACAASQ